MNEWVRMVIGELHWQDLQVDPLSWGNGGSPACDVYCEEGLLVLKHVQ